MNSFDNIFYSIIAEQLSHTALTPIIIYPGRFQPMLPHHNKVFQKLKNTYPNADVYISTTDKVEPGKSPFSFAEKTSIASQLYDIPLDRVLKVSQTYNIEEYAKYFDATTSYLMFAVGKKDMQEDPRFNFNNIDSNTGLNLKKNGEPTALQLLSSIHGQPEDMSKRGYIIVAPTVTSGGKVSSASEFRKSLRESPDPDKFLIRIFGSKVLPVSQLLISKILSGNV